MSEEQKFYVRVCRPRFEVAAIEVFSRDHDLAQLLAACRASELPETVWKLLPFDNSSYFPHVEECVSDHDMSANADSEDPKEALIEEFMSLERERDEKYLLLRGDLFTGEGNVVFEPWRRSGDPELMEEDLSSDWISLLEAVFNKGASANEPWLRKEFFADEDDD